MKSASSQVARRQFTQLATNERLRLVDAIEIRDQRPPITDFYKEFEGELKNVFRPPHRDDFSAR